MSLKVTGKGLTRLFKKMTQTEKQGVRYVMSREMPDVLI